MARFLRLFEKTLQCPDPLKETTLERIKKYVEENKTFPPPCDNCCTVILYSSKKDRSIFNFNKLLHDELKLKTEIKYEGLYLRCKDESRENYMKKLEQCLEKYEVDGRIEWRRCCTKLEERFPYLFQGCENFL